MDRPTRPRPPAALAAAAAAVAAFMVLPVAHLAMRALESDRALALATSAPMREALAATLGLACAVTVVATALGVAMAWVLERTDVPGRAVLGVACALPIVVPTYVAAVALRDAFGPRPLLVEVPGAVGFRGAVVALALSTYPYVLLVVRAALRGADPALEEAARSLGDPRRRVFRRVMVPALRPAAGAGGLLVFLYTLSDFGAVAVLRVETLTVTMFTEYRTSFDRARPAVTGLVLVALTLVAVVAERRVRGRARPPRSVAGTHPPPRTGLGRWRWPVALVTAAVPAVGAGVPVGVLAYRAALGRGPGESASLLVGAAGTSVALSLAAAAVAVALAVPVAILAVRYRSRATAAVESLAVAGYALPGLVIALALVFFAARYVPVVYQTLPLVVTAYVIRFYPEALGSTRAAVAQVDPALEDAARSLGDTRARAVRRVTLPLVRNGVVAGAALVFLTSMKELPATLLLRPPGYDTLATRVWTGAAEGFYTQAAPAGLVLVAISAAVLAGAGRLGGRHTTVAE